MNLKAYALTVVVVVIICQIAETLLVSGRLKSTVKTVFSLITTSIFIAPIISYFKNDFSFEQIYESSQVEIDEGFIDYANYTRQKIYEEKVENCLKEMGVEGGKVKVEMESVGEMVIIKKVEINLQDLVINEEIQHINKTEIAIKVASALNIESGGVVIIE